MIGFVRAREMSSSSSTIITAVLAAFPPASKMSYCIDTVTPAKITRNLFSFQRPPPRRLSFLCFFFYAGKLRHICHDTCTKEQGRRVVSRGLAGEFRSNRAAPGLRQLTDPVATSNLHKKHSWIMSWFYSCTCRVFIFLSGKRLLIFLHKFLLIIQTDGCINLDLPDHFTQSSSSFHFYIY